jgi:DNA (cytosine-5)-methyltransferase 1
MLLPGDPPDNCMVCAKKVAADTAEAPQLVEKGSSIAVHGHSYHLDDFTLVESEGGPCLIGQLINFGTSPQTRDRGACFISLKLFGRVRDMLEKLSDDQIFSDEVFFICVLYRIFYLPFYIARALHDR